MRIVSLVPSITELLYDLGLENEVIAITKFCIHPKKWKKSKTIIGGTKNLHIEKILSLQPDIIFANKEENERSQIENLQQKLKVNVSDIATLQDCYQSILEIGELCGKETIALRIVQDIQHGFEHLKKSKALKVAYLIWNNPMMTVGKDTFIHEIIEQNNWKNAFENHNRYPSISIDQLLDKKIDLLLLSSEPFPFQEKHLLYYQEQLPNVKVMLVDGEMFSWYGSRLIKTPYYLASINNILSLT